jgi:rSAM-associated Gly-rich repeat protein
MSIRRKTKRALAVLLPTGVLGISSALASVHSDALPKEPNSTPDRMPAVADRLREIRSGISEMNALAQKGDSSDPLVLEAVWLNAGFGWRNGGWGNGGWHNWGNGGWHNGGWGNGGWHNAPSWGNGGGWGNGGWPNGWHNAPTWGNGGWNNAWHNFWHNA